MKQAKVSVENLQVAALHFYLPLTKLDGRPLKSFAVIDVPLKTAWKTGFDITLGQKESLCGVNEAAKPLCNNSHPVCSDCAAVSNVSVFFSSSSRVRHQLLLSHQHLHVNFKEFKKKINN